jgi:hypothetical protein
MGRIIPFTNSSGFTENLNRKFQKQLFSTLSDGELTARALAYYIHGQFTILHSQFMDKLYRPSVYQPHSVGQDSRRSKEMPISNQNSAAVPT